MTGHQRSPQSPYRTGYIPSSPSDRTVDWVSRHPPKQPGQFVDPANMPPSDTESAIYTSDSDAESSRSVPPRFVLDFHDGRRERVSDNYYSNSNQKVRSRATSGPVNNYGPPSSHHHSRSSSMHLSTGPLFRPRSSQAAMPPQEAIRILPPQRSMTPGTAGYVSSRSTQAHHSRTTSLLAPNPRRAYDHDLSDSSHYGRQDEWIQTHGPPQAIKFSRSYPPSQRDTPPRDYSANTHRPHSSSKLSRQSVTPPFTHVSQLTKENTIANSHSRTLSRGAIQDDWSVVDDEEWEQPRAAYRRGRTPSSQSSNSPPPLSYSRSRTTSSSSRSGHYPPGPKVSGTDNLGPPPANSAGTSSMKRPFFSRLFGKSLPAAPPPNRLHRRHSISDSRR